MVRTYVRVAMAASAVVGLLLSGSATATATPDSSGNKGDGKPSPSASGNGNSQSNSKGNSPGNSQSGGPGNSSGNSQSGGPGNSPANSEGTKPANPGKPATTQGGNTPGKSASAGSNSAGSNSKLETKTLPDTASPVAQAAVNKDKPVTPVSPNSVPAAEETAETVTPVPENHADDTAMPPAASPQGNGDHVAGGPASPARPATSLTPSAPRMPGADGTESLGVPPTAALTAPGNAAPDAGDGEAAGVGKWLGDVATTIGREVRAALAEVTLKDLALAALPGIAGLLFFLVTGVGLGHRQARFSFALETAGGLRLSPRGPLGVVGSDSFVHVSARAAKSRNRTLHPVDRAA